MYTAVYRTINDIDIVVLYTPVDGLRKWNVWNIISWALTLIDFIFILFDPRKPKNKPNISEL